MTKAVKAVETAVPAFLKQDTGDIEGFENADSDSFAIPFLRLLQSGSPVVKKSDPAAYIKGAEEGMFLETVSRTLYDGEEGVSIVIAKFDRKFVEWKEDGGFVGEHAPNSHVVADAVRDTESSKLLLQNTGTYLEDTRYLYVIVDAGIDVFPALLTMKSTQIKKSKALMSFARNLCNKHKVNLFGLKFKVTSVPESNDKNSWWGVKFDFESLVGSEDVYKEVTSFRDSLIDDAVEVKPDFDSDF